MPFLFAIALMAASYLISSLLAKKQQPVTDIGQIPLPQSSEGEPQPVVFGDVWIPNWTVLWWGNLRNEPIHASGK